MSTTIEAMIMRALLALFIMLLSIMSASVALPEPIVLPDSRVIQLPDRDILERIYEAD